MKKKKALDVDSPLLHACHKKPVTRRDFISQGLMTGCGVAMSGGLMSLFANPRQAHAALSPDLEALKSTCGIRGASAGKIPFICFDLAGGANIAGSNVLVGQQDGQLDFLSTAGYSKLGIPGDMTPSSSTTNSFVDTDLGLAFHTDSAMLRGIKTRFAQANWANVNGAVYPARSENDTGNNPHNPMYYINKAGADGSLLTLIGSRSSDSGGNSMAPARSIDAKVRPTKIDRPTDVTGLVDLGDLIGLLDQSDTVAVMEAVQRISDSKLSRTNTKVSNDAVIKELVRCGYVKTADLADRFGNPSSLNPTADVNIVGPAGIFNSTEFNADREYMKTASIMKLVVSGFAGAGTVTMGGYDYHTGERGTGERRDFRAGECIGACLQYAALLNTPLMIYVFSDGSVASNGAADDSQDGRGKGQWTGDNQSTAASFTMVYNPNGRPALMGGNAAEQARHQQIGYMSANASVSTSATPGSNNVNLLAEMVALNYMALHGEQGQFASVFTGHGLGNTTLRDSLVSFNPIVNGTI